jgi:uncharacterized zinc-type alcohol dehydrogenase-like protein
MLPTRGYATDGPFRSFRPFDFERRDPGSQDVLIRVRYCGICHSDIHQAREEWGQALFPMVPGHEVIGEVVSTGASVRKFQPGDVVGVGCFVDSCRTCTNCTRGLEQFCSGHLSFSYNCTEQDLTTPTYGGYSHQMVVAEPYVVRIPSGMDPAAAAPLLCAGVTTYSPLRTYGVGNLSRVGIVGLGGLGHIGVRIAASMGAAVTVLSTSPEKADDARRLGAGQFCLTTSEADRKRLADSFDLILNTVAAPHDLGMFLDMLDLDGTMVLLGVPAEPFQVAALPLIARRRRVAGSLIGGMGETQAMLDYCGSKGIACDVEIIPVQQIDEAYERTVRGDVRYRFVIDLDSLGS